MLWVTATQVSLPTQSPNNLSFHYVTDPLSLPCRIYSKLESIKTKLKLTKRPRDKTIDGLTYAWPAFKLALTVFEKTLDGVPIPGLKGSIGGFLELAKIAEVCAEQPCPQSCLPAYKYRDVHPELGGCPRTSEADRETYRYFYAMVRSAGAPCRAQNSDKILLRVGSFLFRTHWLTIVSNI
jgi:hypothetical protein